MASTHPPFIFTGDKMVYFEFLSKLRQALGEQAYLLNRTGNLYTQLSEVLPANPPNLGNNPSAQAIANRKEYFHKKDLQMNHDRHSYRAIGIFLSCLSPEVYAQLEDVDRAEHATAFAKWSALWERFDKLYKPKGGRDADHFRRRLQELTDEDGYLSFAAKFRGLVANMTAIPKLNAQGNPIPEQNYRPDDEELRSLLLNKLGANGNTHFINLRTKYLADETKTWSNIVDEIVILCNDPDKRIDTIRRKTMKTAAASVRRGRGFQLRRPPFCANCKQAHLTRDCEHSYCFTCRQDFGSPEARRAHAQVEHPGRAARQTAGLTPAASTTGTKRSLESQQGGGNKGKKARATPAPAAGQPGSTSA